MATINITLKDVQDLQTGNRGVSFNVNMDTEGAPPNSAPTQAMIAGTAVMRLWQSQSLPALARLICPDLIAQSTPKPPAPADGVPAQDARPTAPVKRPPPVKRTR